jgi:pyroglutamyl-peptidase
MRILLTAFEPFDGTGLNSSLEGCRAYLDRWAAELDLRFALLPVEYGPDVIPVEQALAEEPADVILHTGQASGAAEIRVERIAVNARYADGERESWGRPQDLIEPGGPAGLFATIPVDAVASAIRGAGVPAVVSNHAGIYLCNHALYRSLRREELSPTGARVGFLHVPRLPEQAGNGAPCMPAETIALGIRAALRRLVDAE